MRTTCSLLLVLLLSPASAAADETPGVTVEFLSETMIPAGMRYQDTCVGGLSAIEYDRLNDRYFALSDARKNARFYTLEIDVGSDGDGRPFLTGVAFKSVVRLLTREGEPYGDGRVDPEGFVLVSGSDAFISSEGAAELGVPPFVDRIDVATGRFLQSAAIPVAFRPWGQGGEQLRGVRKNLGFESLTLSPDRRNLYAASESALAQDLAGIDPDARIPFATLFSRLLHFRLDPPGRPDPAGARGLELEAVPRLAAEFLYPLVQPQGDIVVHGLAELLALDDGGRLLALERTFGHDVGMVVKLFEVHLGDTLAGVDRSRLAPAARDLPVVKKRLVLDFADLPILIDNFEGLTLGPMLPGVRPSGGGESLLVLGDNDNVDCRNPLAVRPTKILLFRLHR